MIGELDANGVPQFNNTFGPAGLISRYNNTSESTVYYLYDPLGNVQHRLDGAGAIVTTDIYDAWGNVLAGGDPTDPFGYKGEYGYYKDQETSLILCGHRYYDTTTGRWINRDPSGYEGGINHYGYCGDDPVNKVDPEGLIENRLAEKRGPFDIAGLMLIEHYNWGLGNIFFRSNDPLWTAYMESNVNLKTEAQRRILKFASTVPNGSSKFMHLVGHADLDNGYFTGYQLLGGANTNVLYGGASCPNGEGGFIIDGYINKAATGVATITARYSWNDKMDLMDKHYTGDFLAKAWSKTFWNNGQSYPLTIAWTDTSTLDSHGFFRQGWLDIHTLDGIVVPPPITYGGSPCYIPPKNYYLK